MQLGKLNASLTKKEKQQSCLKRPHNTLSCCTNHSTGSVPPASNYFTLNSILPFSEVSKEEGGGGKHTIKKSPNPTTQKKAQGSEKWTSEAKRTPRARGAAVPEQLLPAETALAPHTAHFLMVEHCISPQLSSPSLWPRTPSAVCETDSGAQDAAPGKAFFRLSSLEL